MKKHIRLILLIWVTVLVQPLVSQNNSSLTGLIFYARYNTGTMKSSSFAQYVQTIPGNGGIKRNLASGVSFGFTTVFSHRAFMVIDFSTLNQKIKVPVNNDEWGYTYSMKGLTWGIGYSLSAANTSTLLIVPEAGAIFGANSILSAQTNARYKASPATNLYGGLSVHFGDRIQVVGKVQYIFTAIKGLMSNDDAQAGFTEIPVNYPAWAASPVYYTGDFVKSDFRSLSVSLGLAVKFGG